MPKPSPQKRTPNDDVPASTDDGSGGGPNIPLDRPVIGTDLITLRERLGHSLGESLFLLGMYGPKHYELTSPLKNGNNRIDRGTVAIMARLLDAVPEWDPLPKPVNFPAFVERLQRHDNKLTLKKIGVILGGDSNAAYRWMRGEPMGPIVATLVRIVDTAVREHGKQGLDLFLDVVEAERQARGKLEKNFYSNGSWREASDAKR